MEEFKNSVPLSIKTHLEEHQITKLKKAAVVADDYELTHKMSVGKTNFQSKGFYKNTDKGKSDSEARNSFFGGGVSRNLPRMCSDEISEETDGKGGSRVSVYRGGLWCLAG